MYAVKIRSPVIKPTLSRFPDRICQTVMPMIPPTEAPLSPVFVGVVPGVSVIWPAHGRVVPGAGVAELGRIR
jgi:hypothetical protein